MQVDSSNVLTYDAAKPGLDFSNGAADRYLYVDADKEVIPMAFNRADFLAARSKGVLLLHLHNTRGIRDQVIPITDASGAASGTPRGVLDKPADGATLSGDVVLEGWAYVLSGNMAGLPSRIELFVDGAFGMRLPVGFSRPDVSAYLATQGITAPGNLGFSGVWNSRAVLDGDHVLLVRAADATGAVRENSGEIARINVKTRNGMVTTSSTLPPTTTSTVIVFSHEHNLHQQHQHHAALHDHDAPCRNHHLLDLHHAASRAGRASHAAISAGESAAALPWLLHRRRGRGTGQPEGVWGIEVLVGDRLLQGGLNLGGAVGANGSLNGWGSF